MEKRRDKLTALYIDAVLNGEPGFEPSRCLQALLDVGISRVTAERLVAQEKVRRRPPAVPLPPAEERA
ncbi:hypothetical protein GJV26_27310 [Massilia dura]|uniref:Uncharacterized protein n=1 Tax=Pseudoduganella dura TaxID=321982 RepID=A0A6I3XHY9_9BURK|nr:hypothetical protein [Pseudoduganella dura]MUI16137.1 hypothetical protein [Pseudoduganella dura]GGY10678.1 hypothetical protein GCM10007386_46330 [Pseudoduganella dura]